MSKIGIMGGTFDPIHNGHLFIGRKAKEEYQLDQIWYMPSGQPPHKKDHRITDKNHRCNMVKLALEGQNGMIFSDFEIQRPGNTYTAKTLSLLKEDYPNDKFYFILGADSLYEIEQWYHPEQIMEYAVILAACREYSHAHLSLKKQIDYLIQKYNGEIYPIHSQEIHVSSEEIRAMISEGKRPERLLPKTVYEYIQEYHLYL
ncbi:MAG: nicotinate (nicotinamide) nucleotide adenylyltransferase [Lachnospiraceae bacterium]|jgi:nicotinate-nucleotide adenylyltransferase|nr:nicotinate (nicotinamide) nucleotide adenylyltransferase [Lachnospiraceae bacterium]